MKSVHSQSKTQRNQDIKKQIRCALDSSLKLTIVFHSDDASQAVYSEVMIKKCESKKRKKMLADRILYMSNSNGNVRQSLLVYSTVAISHGWM